MMDGPPVYLSYGKGLFALEKRNSIRIQIFRGAKRKWIYTSNLFPTYRRAYLFATKDMDNDMYCKEGIILLVC